MDWSKAKNLILYLLILMNLFLLGNLGLLLYSNYAAERQTTEDLSQYLSALGIALDPDIVPRDNPGREILVLERSTEREDTLARELLANQALEESEVGSYQTEAGFLTLRVGAYFEAGLSDISNTEALMSRCEVLDVTDVKSDPTGSTFTMKASYAGYPVFNAGITAQQETDGWRLSGRLCVGTPLRTESGTERDVAGLIVSMTPRLQLYETTKITNIEIGWVTGTISNVGLRLTPVYKITADSGEFYVNAVDGTLMSAE